MSSKNDQGFFSNLKSDLPASVVVFLVALPLCLGIALASDAPLFSGVIAGIVGGTVVALLSGSPLGVSGPAAGLAAIVATAINELESFDIFLMAVVLAGVIQFIFGLLRAGIIGYYFPTSVIKGMLSGIGIVIFMKQIPHAVGYDKDPEGDFAFWQMDGHNSLSDLGYMFDLLSPGVIIITAVSLAILILWERPFMKAMSWTKIIPGPLVAVLSGVGLNVLFKGNSQLALNADQSVEIPSASSFEGITNLFATPDFTALWNNPEIYLIAGTIALVASLETLLCVEATDKLDPQKRITPTNRELLAQGTGNTISGLIGGLPITQVIVRSSANIQSGGKTKASAFFHGILLLICVLSIPSLLNLIPYASLAAILFIVGWKLAKPSLFKAMYKQGIAQFIPFVATVAGIYFLDLLKGIAIGLALAIFHILYNNFKVPYHFDEDDHEEGKVKLRLAEDVSFLNKAGILRTLNELPNDIHLIIDATKTKSIHPDVIEIIDDFKINAETRNITVEVVGLDEVKFSNPEAQLKDKLANQPATEKKETQTILND